MTRADRRPRRRLDAETRRAAILAAARDAFAAGTYQEVSLSAIGAAAGASEALVLRYFGSKAALYVACVAAAVDLLLERQRAADEALPPDTGPYSRIAASIRVYLDFIAAFPRGWAGPLRTPSGSPAEAEELRVQLRRHYVELLRSLLGPVPDLALHGYLGFLDAACLAWVEAGLPEADREHLVAMAVAALAGAVNPPLARPVADCDAGGVHAFDVLGDPVRRRILELLADGERPAGEVSAIVQAEFGISQPGVSQHLRVLRENGFATVRADGARRLYAVDPAPLREIDAWLDRYRRFWSQPLDALATELARGRRPSSP